MSSKIRREIADKYTKIFLINKVELFRLEQHIREAILRSLEQYHDAIDANQQQAKAWMAVVKTLDEVRPGWMAGNSKTAEESAVEAIRKLAETASEVDHQLMLTVGTGLRVYGSYEAIQRAQAYCLVDSTHKQEAEGNRRYFARALQEAEAKIAKLEDELAKKASLESAREFIRDLAQDGGAATAAIRQVQSTTTTNQLPDGLDWKDAPSWATGCGKVGLCSSVVWFDSEKYQYVNRAEPPYKFAMEDSRGGNYKRSDVRTLSVRTPHDWVKWEGGEFKPHLTFADRAYDFIRRDGTLAAFVKRWNQTGENDDIVAYRLRPPANPDMTDWRNWRPGDVLEFLGESICYTKGANYVLAGIRQDMAEDKHEFIIIDNDRQDNPWKAETAARAFRWVRHHASRDATQG